MFSKSLMRDRDGIATAQASDTAMRARQPHATIDSVNADGKSNDV